MISNKRLYIDLETTGFGSNAAILQIACIIEIAGKIERKFVINMTPHAGANVKVNADFHTRIGSTNVMSQRRGYERFKRELEVFVNKYNPKDKFHFVAYNAEFDKTKMKEFFDRFGDNFLNSYFFTPSLCLMQKAAWTLQKVRHKLINFKLGTVCQYMNIDIDESKLHDGTYDIAKSYELDQKLDEYQRNSILNEQKKTELSVGARV